MKTDDLIKEFIDIKGLKVYEQIKEYLIDHDICEEFIQNIYPDVNKLFAFSVKYGIYDLMTFLYEDLNIEYNLNILLDYDEQINKNQDIDPNKVLVDGSPSGKQGLNLRLEDKFSKNRNICIAYLVASRKWSKINFEKGNFYYKYNNNKRKKL